MKNLDVLLNTRILKSKIYVSNLNWIKRVKNWNPWIEQTNKNLLKWFAFLFQESRMIKKSAPISLKTIMNVDL